MRTAELTMLGLKKVVNSFALPQRKQAISDYNGEPAGYIKLLISSAGLSCDNH